MGNRPNGWRFAVDRALTPDDRAAYVAFLSGRRTTLAGAAAWLRARGYDGLSPGAIQRHRQHTLAAVAAERDETRAHETLLRLVVRWCTDVGAAPRGRREQDSRVFLN